MGAVLTATACLESSGENLATDLGVVEANLRELGAREPRAWVDERRGRLGATFEIEAEDVTSARLKLDGLLDQLAHVVGRRVIGAASYVAD